MCLLLNKLKLYWELMREGHPNKKVETTTETHESHRRTFVELDRAALMIEVSFPSHAVFFSH